MEATAAIGTPLQWGMFLLLVGVMLALDLGVINRKEHEIGLREALFWSVVWTVIALIFNGWVYYEFGSQAGLEFLTGYIIERSLSFDNIFVFIVIFNYFAVPARYQHRVLFWGILGALISRGIFIAMGTALLTRFDWLIYVFGAFLVYTGFKILKEKETEVHPENNPVVKLFQRLMPMTAEYHGKRFFVRQAGRRVATPLMLVLVVVEATDVVFAVDSIPAVFGVTQNPFIVFTSNIFAILGLRALYFLLAGLMHKFRYLGVGLGLVLVFVGAKMLIHHWYVIPTVWSLALVMLILTVAIVVSLLRPASPDEVPHAPAPGEPADFQHSQAARELHLSPAADEPPAHPRGSGGAA
ncbi:MAG TPA: TerC/Alx family metal homeostasis membrane protein [Thermoanaerobaculia bacterium]|nr:TerC/Alx family metal homeostasis membrane protein [Thermoanaerobaculia bacterium]